MTTEIKDVNYIYSSAMNCKYFLQPLEKRAQKRTRIIAGMMIYVSILTGFEVIYAILNINGVNFA